MSTGMKLSDQLTQWRAERPSEWKMDEFIRLAKELEGSTYGYKFYDRGVLRDCSIVISNPDSEGYVVVEDITATYHLIDNKSVQKK